MTPDTRKSYFLTIGIFCALLVTFLVPDSGSSRIIAAILLLPAMVLTLFLLRKRGILSINKGQVSLIMAVSSLLYIMFNYFSSNCVAITTSFVGIESAAPSCETAIAEAFAAMDMISIGAIPSSRPLRK